jgi:hypothetical protein
MLCVRNPSWLPANLLLVLLLTGAQSGALAHAFEHDAGTPQYQACASCVMVNQLDASCVDTLVATDIGDCDSCRPDDQAATLESLQAPAARQRGPPCAL